MIREVVSIEIATTPERVFRYLADPAKTSEWVESCAELRPTAPGAFREGSGLAYTQRQGGRVAHFEGRVARLETDRALEFEYANAGLHVRVGFAIATSPGGTSVAQTITITPKSLLMKVLAPMIRSATRRGSAADVRRLKQLLESSC